MSTILGLKPIDVAVIVAYFVVVMAIGFWASRRVRNEVDYFLGGRRFGKGLLVMHWLCTGTHSEMAVQVAGATARVGLGGIWYQWMWLFSTPFYWLIAPINRRLRVITTGDFFRIRYGRSTELLYCVVALVYFAQTIAMLLRGAGAAISGATGGAVPTQYSVVVLSILFSTYVVAGGLVAAAYTDFFQGVMIIVLSVLLIPAALGEIGGMSRLHERLDPSMLSITAPAGAREGNPWFVIAMSVLGLVGVVVQPHVMSATGSGKTETEARVGMCYGNFIKRLLTIAWAFTGVIAIAHFPELLAGLDLTGEPARRASEQLFGRCIQQFLGDGWRGLMIACLVAGVTSAETFMVVGSALVTRNLYEPLVRGRSERHYLWVGRIASAGLLAAGIVWALNAESVTWLVVNHLKVIALPGAAFWSGVTWRRATSAGVWASVLGAAAVWAATTLGPDSAGGSGVLDAMLKPLVAAGDLVHLRELAEPLQILLMLAVEFGLLVGISLLGRSPERSRLDPFFARLHTPVGQEDAMRLDEPAGELPESATLGMNGVVLDYRKSSVFAYGRLQRLGIEIPRMGWTDWCGFAAAWAIVAALIGLLVWLAGLGR